MPLLSPDGTETVSFTSVGRNEVFDFTVPGFHNYVMAGVVHHNTVAGAYESTLHLTGDYPEWWTGKRFDCPIDGWAAGDTSETTRDVIQHELLGKAGEFGTGMIPFDKLVGEPTKRRGVADAVDTIRVQHKSGGVSTIGLKSYDQGRKKFQGTAKHLIWADEEPPEDVYDEMVMRTMTTNGIVLCTFTPLSGLTQVALRFLPHLAIKLEGEKK